MHYGSKILHDMASRDLRNENRVELDSLLPRPNRCREHMVASRGPDRDDAPRPACQSIAQKALQLADLVAAVDGARSIVAFDP